MKKLIAVLFLSTLAWAGRDFDGVDDYLNLGDATSIVCQFPMTVACWVNPDSSTLHGMAVLSRNSGQADGSGCQFSVGVFGGGTDNHLGFTKSAVIDIEGTATTEPATGAWSYVGAVVTSTNVRFLKVSSGTLSAENVADSNAFDNSPTPTNTKIAASTSPTGNPEQFFDGKLGYCSVWDAALSDLEFEAAATFPIQARPTSRRFLMPIWGVDSPEPDISGNKNNGTVNGTTLSIHPPVGASPEI